MSQTQNRRGGRPANMGHTAVGGSVADRLRVFSDAFTRIYGVEVRSPDLHWRIPFENLIEKLQTVGGIAGLAGVSRKTVYRKMVPVGSEDALYWVIDKRRGTRRAIVTSADPECRLNFDPTFSRILDVVQGVRDNDYGTVEYTLNGLKLMPRTRKAAKDGLPPTRRKRRQRIHASKYRTVSANEAQDIQRRARAGQVFRYRPVGKVTVAQVCTFGGINRGQFYSWRDSLLPGHLRLLNSLLKGKPLRFLSADIPDLGLNTNRDDGESQTREAWNERLEPIVTKEQVEEELYARLDGE